MLTAVPKIKRHMKATHANSTLATDGERIVAFFGSEGLYAFDMKGTPIWKKDLGVLDAGYYVVPEAQWETGSSPILHEGVVVVQADVQKGSFIAAFDAKDGKELWRKTRDDVPTWSTPTVHEVGGRTQLLVNGMRHVGAYDFKTGEEILEAVGRRRHPGADAGRQRRPDLRHQRPRPDGAGLRHPRHGERRRVAQGRRRQERRGGLELSARRRLHVPRRSSIAASSTWSPTTGS